jgi:hypothetical protein
MIKLTDIEFDLLQQLCTDERQISAIQSHREMYRLVDAGYIKATSINADSVLYTILPRGQQAREQLLGSAPRRAGSFASAAADRSQDNRKARRPRRWAALECKGVIITHARPLPKATLAPASAPDPPA